MGTTAKPPGKAPRADAFTFDDVAVVMGTYNEVEAVAGVIDDVAAATDGRASVVCVDSSDDGTAEVARARGARVIEQPPRGYGVALLAGLRAVERPVVVTTDCDGTYPMDRIPDLLELVNEGYDVVGGDRISPGADTMPALNRAGNRAFAVLSTALSGARVRDATSGMRAYHREVVRTIEWTENTGLSAELLLRPLVRGYHVTEVPIDYAERTGETTLDPLSGGAAIATSIVRVCLEERRRRLRGH